MSNSWEVVTQHHDEDRSKMMSCILTALRSRPDKCPYEAIAGRTSRPVRVVTSLARALQPSFQDKLTPRQACDSLQQPADGRFITIVAFELLLEMLQHLLSRHRMSLSTLEQCDQILLRDQARNGPFRRRRR